MHDGAVDLGEEALGGGAVLGDDRVGVLASRSGSICAIAPSTPSTTRTERIGSRYSVRQSVSVAAMRLRIERCCTAASPRTSQPASCSIGEDRRQVRVAATARSISSVSAAPQTLMRRILALSTMSRAMARSASRST